jgi:hypothetical protein
MHPELINHTPFALSLLYIGREPDGLLHGVALMQATWRIGRGGELQLVEMQPAPPAGGQWYGDPATSSLRAEPQTAAAKPGVDIVMLGHAVAPGAQPVRMLGVTLAVGELRKQAVVFGDRELGRGLVGLTMSTPQPFERLPLVYERAFGGWDRRHQDPAQHRCEMRNPVGLGFRDARLGACVEARLPNIEDPAHPFKPGGPPPPPCGFGFVAAGWMPRASLAGTFDGEWQRTRSPLLPLDFDPRFHNAASPGLVAPALRGDEPVLIEGMSADAPCRFTLPGIPAPWCGWSLRRRERQRAPLKLDTVIIDMDQRWLQLQWRGCWALPDGPHALQALEARLPTNLGPAASATLAAAPAAAGMA